MPQVGFILKVVLVLKRNQVIKHDTTGIKVIERPFAETISNSIVVSKHTYKLSKKEQRRKWHFEKLELAKEKKRLKKLRHDTLTAQQQMARQEKIAKRKSKNRPQKKDAIEFYNTTEWKQTRKRILLRDNYKCQECGKETYLHIHHIKYRFASNLDQDLITLCKFCHAKKHPVNGNNILRY